MLSDDSVKDFCAVLRNCDAASLYKASQEYAKFHNYRRNGENISIDNTSLTIIQNMMAQTKTTPEDEVDDMRKKRVRALEAFCYIYGGYIALKLKLNWKGRGFRDIPRKDDFIATATEQTLNSLLRALERDGYKQGKFSHLVHMAISKKTIDVQRKYATWKKNHPEQISFETAQKILGGVLEIADENGTFDDACDTDRLDVYAVFTLIANGEVRTAHAHDDREMFIRLYVKKERAEDIARDMDVSVATVYRRTKALAAAAIEQYRETQRQMEENLQ